MGPDVPSSSWVLFSCDGSALVLVFVIVICFGDWFSVGYQRHGMLGLFLVAVGCGAHLCRPCLLCGGLKGLVLRYTSTVIYRGSGVLACPPRIFRHPSSTS